MTIEFVCPSCQRRLTVPATFAGKNASCPACGHVSTVVATTPVEEAIVAEVVPAEHVVKPVEANWLLRTPDGVSYGPVSRAELEEWVRQGRVTSDCDVRGESDSQWQAADTIFPALAPWTPGSQAAAPSSGGGGSRIRRSPLYPAAGAVSARRPTMSSSPAVKSSDSTSGGDKTTELGTLAPDRGILILTLGLVGLIVQCPVFSVMAWVMGTADVQEMRAGRMDLDGLNLTQWGRRLGIIVSVLWLGLTVLGTAWAMYMATL